MRRRNDTLYPVRANAGRRIQELALAWIAGARMAPVMRRGELVPLLHATDVGVIARPGHEAVLIKTLAVAP